MDLRALGRLREAVEPLRAAAERAVEQEKLKDAAVSASNLSQLHVMLGDFADAVAMGETSVTYADQSENLKQRMLNRTVLGDALHKAGEQARAQELFEEAEALQAEWEPHHPWLYSVQGYLYCDPPHRRRKGPAAISRIRALDL